MNLRSLVFASCLAAFGATCLSAHHSLAAEFDTSKPITLTGKVTKLDWRNPHAWIYIDVKNDKGVIEKWQCELGSPNAMQRAGFSREDVKEGDEVVLDGVRARDGSRTISTRVVKAKDGRTVLSQTAR
jgi:hypothetical protein